MSDKIFLSRDIKLPFQHQKEKLQCLYGNQTLPIQPITLSFKLRDLSLSGPSHCAIQRIIRITINITCSFCDAVATLFSYITKPSSGQLKEINSKVFRL